MIYRTETSRAARARRVAYGGLSPPATRSQYLGKSYDISPLLISLHKFQVPQAVPSESLGQLCLTLAQDCSRASTMVSPTIQTQPRLHHTTPDTYPHTPRIPAAPSHPRASPVRPHVAQKVSAPPRPPAPRHTTQHRTLGGSSSNLCGACIIWRADKGPPAGTFSFDFRIIYFRFYSIIHSLCIPLL